MTSGILTPQTIGRIARFDVSQLPRVGGACGALDFRGRAAPKKCVAISRKGRKADVRLGEILAIRRTF
ncbi:MAG: hypothetical protein ACT4O2_16080 [Beijerinckiaceae bacterium]